MSELLPPNATAQEQALEAATARVGTVPVAIDTLWTASACPADLLPWLAWALSVDEWDTGWSEVQQRVMIAASYALHSHKGTPQAVREALVALGYDTVQIREGEVYHHNGDRLHDGSFRHGADGFWPLFDVVLNIGTAPDAPMVQKIKNRIGRYKNARSVLRNLIFTSLFHNGVLLHDGTYQHNGGIL